MFVLTNGSDVAGTMRTKSKAVRTPKSKRASPQIRPTPHTHPPILALWNARPLDRLDLFYGPGGKGGAPDLTGTFAYTGVDTHGSQKKIYVRDTRGREWTVKYGP